jgi:hypothetical protein
MTDDDPEPDETPDAAEAEGEEPDLDGDDYVEVPDEVAEEVAAETPPDDQGDQDDTDDGDDSPPTPGDASGDDAPPLGDLYCNILGMAAASAKESKGSGVEDKYDQADEYVEMAKWCEVDSYVDEWARQHGGPGMEDLSPGQGVVIGTTMFAVMVLADDPELAEGLFDDSEQGSGA